VDAKENALRIIRFDDPQRVTAGPPMHTIGYTGVNHENCDGGGGHDCPVGTTWTDVWGTTWKKVQAGLMGFPQVHPLAKMESLRSYRWPDADDERVCGRIREQAAKSTGEAFLCGSHRETVWEKSYMLVGMEDLMTYLFTEPGYAREIFRRVMDFDLAIARHYLAQGVEFVFMGDDLGSQSGPLLGPEIVEGFLVPEYRRLFELYRSRGVLIAFHSCGNMASLADTFMDLGVNVLNPVQATANDLDELRRKTAGRMALQGAISTATIMAGPAERIVAEVRQRLWQLGREGGYFCAPDQGLPFPQEHVDALNEAVEQYGQYPLSPP